MKVFYYVPSILSGEILECGLKKNEWWEREAELNGEKKSCMVAYLHPVDCPHRKDPSYVPIQIDLAEESAYVAEGALQSQREWYERSIVPLSSYSLGQYRQPECLIPKTIFPNRLFAYDCRRGEPILYESSEALYLNRIKCQAIETYEDFYELAMMAYYEKLVRQGDYEAVPGTAVTVYRKKDDGRLITVKLPGEIQNAE